MVAAYFDDELSLEFIRHADVSQKGLHCVFNAFGSPPQPPKSFSPAADRNYLGTSIHVGEAECSGCIRVQPKSTTVCKVVERIDASIARNSLPREAAGKLRGELTRMLYAAPLLRKCHAHENAALSDEDVTVLRALKHMVLAAPPRDVSILGSPPHFLSIYTDASFEGGSLWLGWVIMPPCHSQPFGATRLVRLVPPEVVESWKERNQQIYPGETLCVFAATLDLWRPVEKPRRSLVYR